MADKLTPENFMFTFRCYRGEEENPYAADNSPNGRAWSSAWTVEELVSKREPQEIIDLWENATDKPEEIMGSDLSENEKAVAYAVYSAADSFMTEEALADYLKWPVVEVIGE